MDLPEYLAELTCGEDARAEAAARALANLSANAAPQVIPALQELLDAPTADHRWWALRTLAAIQHPDIPGILIDALADPEPSLRQCAALGLRLHPSAQAVPALAAILADPDPLAADLASDALIANSASAVPALLEIMGSASQGARLRAVRALAIIGDTRAIPVLFAALDEDSAWIAYWAEQGLERMGVGMMFFKP
jgi:HEAT repeat protein